MRIPLTVRFGKGETPASLASRIACRNGRDLIDFCDDVRLGFQAIVDGSPKEVRRLAVLAGADPDDVLQEAMTKIGDREYRYRGERVTRHILHRSHLHICPTCVEEDLRTADYRLEARPYRRTTWLFSSIRSCAIHHRELVPVMQGELRHAHDVAFLMKQAIPRLSELDRSSEARSPTGFERYVVARLTVEPVSDWLATMPLYAAIRSCLVVGAVERHGRDVRLDDLSSVERSDAEQVGYDLLRSGPAGLRDLLTRLQDLPMSQRDRRGPKGTFGRLYEWIAHETDDPAYEPIRDVIREHMGVTASDSPVMRVFGEENDRTLTSVRAISVRDGHHPKRLRKILASRGLVTSRQDAGTDVQTIVSTTQARSLLDDMKDGMTLTEVAQHLNVPRPHDAMLVREGFIVPIVRGKTAMFKNHLIRRRDADAFLERLLVDVDPSITGGASYVDLRGAAKRNCCHVADVVRLLLDRKLTRVGQSADASGFLSILVDPEEARALLFQRDPSMLSLREVEQLMKTSTLVVKRLIAAGHLQGQMVKNGVTGRKQTVVARENVEGFIETHVSLMTIARENKRPIRGLRDALLSHGIRPALTQDDVGVNFYRRRDVSPPPW